jgi:hypothetical protein
VPASLPLGRADKAVAAFARTNPSQNRLRNQRGFLIFAVIGRRLSGFVCYFNNMARGACIFSCILQAHRFPNRQPQLADSLQSASAPGLSRTVHGVKTICAGNEADVFR